MNITCAILVDRMTLVEESQEIKLSIGDSVHDPTDPTKKLLYNALAMIPEFEADLIRSRAREGMKIAKAKGRLRGKQPKLTAKQEARLNQLHAAGEYSKRELAELFFVGRSTVYCAIDRAERTSHRKGFLAAL